MSIIKHTKADGKGDRFDELKENSKIDESIVSDNSHFQVLEEEKKKELERNEIGNFP